MSYSYYASTGSYTINYYTSTSDSYKSNTYTYTAPSYWTPPKNNREAKKYLDKEGGF